METLRPRPLLTRLINVVNSQRINKAGLIICTTFVFNLSLPSPAFADISGGWDLTGTLKINSSVKGKTQTSKKTGFISVIQFDTVESQKPFSLRNDIFQISGNWESKKTAFTATPDVSIVRTLFSGIKKDLQARSNLALSFEPVQWKLTGKEIIKKGKPAKITGTLTLKATTFFQDYVNAKKNEPYKGALVITYSFTGTKAE